MDRNLFMPSTVYWSLWEIPSWGHQEAKYRIGQIEIRQIKITCCFDCFGRDICLHDRNHIIFVEHGWIGILIGLYRGYGTIPDWTKKFQWIWWSFGDSIHRRIECWPVVGGPYVCCEIINYVYFCLGPCIAVIDIECFGIMNDKTTVDIRIWNILCCYQWTTMHRFRIRWYSRRWHASCFYMLCSRCERIDREREQCVRSQRHHDQQNKTRSTHIDSQCGRVRWRWRFREERNRNRSKLWIFGQSMDTLSPSGRDEEQQSQQNGDSSPSWWELMWRKEHYNWVC